MVSSSEVGSKGKTKEKSDVERSLRKRLCKTPGCMLDDGTVEEDREGMMIARRLKKLQGQVSAQAIEFRVTRRCVEARDARGAMGGRTGLCFCLCPGS